MSASFTQPLDSDSLAEITAVLEPRLRSLALRYVRDADAAPLAERDRELLERSALADIGTVSYARAEGLDPATVKSRAHRARRRLAALLRTNG